MATQDVYQQLSEAIGTNDSIIVPEIFKRLVDEREATLLMAASPPATTAELAAKTGLTAELVEVMLGDLFIKGLVFKSKKPDGTRYYRVRHLIQFHDATILTPGLSQDILDLWKEFNKEEFPRFMSMIEEFLPKPASRVIPINTTIPQTNQVLAFEDVKSMVNEAYNLAVVPCTCRLVDGACGKSVDVCLQLNKAADYTLDRGTGRQIQPEEALEILKRCEEEGLVHVVDNGRSLGNLICNCCEDCCIAWPGERQVSKRFVAPSRFAAQVDIQACTLCEACLERCFFEAMTLDWDASTLVINEDKCMGCGLCLVVCSEGALDLVEVREQSFVG